MSIVRFYFLIAAIVWTAGCASPPKPNPLLGWKNLGSAYEVICPFGQTIIEDYKKYIRSLSREERASADDFHISFYDRDSSRQRAVEVTVNLNGTRWKHVLIYDEDGKRTQLIKYASSRYRS